MTFTALFDANVLVPVTVTDLLLRCAEQGYFEPRWSDRILEEVAAVLVRLNPPLTEEAASGRIGMMNEAFPEAQLLNWNVHVDRFDALPDPGDAHVCAAAVSGGVDVIVTFNGKHFPRDVLEDVGVFAQDPDEFMLDLWDLKPSYPQGIVSIIDAMSEQKKLTWRDTVRYLAKAGLPRFANLVTEWHYDNRGN